jgi:hypothetical protein
MKECKFCKEEVENPAMAWNIPFKGTGYLCDKCNDLYGGVTFENFLKNPRHFKGVLDEREGK